MKKTFEKVLFVKRPFWSTCLVLILLSLPWWLAYWPGTLQYDSCGQLLQYLGVAQMTGHHPLPVSMLMGQTLEIGRKIFHSDNAGIFIYTGIQFLVQTFVVGYAFSLFQKADIPVWYRWLCLLFYSLFPLVPNWGISYIKDTGYYISFLLFTLLLWDMLLQKTDSCIWWKNVLWIGSLIGLVAFRNDGRYIVIITLILLLFNRKQRKRSLAGAVAVLLFLFLLEGVYMPLRNIPSGSVREALSVPLMQTAKYTVEHGEEITDEEEQILLSVFAVEDLATVAEQYDSEISDNVKGLFQEYPTGEELLSYVKVWWKQFWKHPATYIQTYWEHCDGYFLPWEKCYDNIIGWFKILDGQQRTDEYLDIYFGTEDTGLRNAMEKWAYFWYDLPVIGLLFRPAVHTLIMTACLIWLGMKKSRKEMLAIIPGCIVLLICTVSPLNASVRYYLPVMVSTPIYLAVVLCSSQKVKNT